MFCNSGLGFVRSIGFVLVKGLSWSRVCPGQGFVRSIGFALVKGLSWSRVCPGQGFVRKVCPGQGFVLVKGLSGLQGLPWSRGCPGQGFVCSLRFALAKRLSWSRVCPQGLSWSRTQGLFLVQGLTWSRACHCTVGATDFIKAFVKHFYFAYFRDLETVLQIEVPVASALRFPFLGIISIFKDNKHYDNIIIRQNFFTILVYMLDYEELHP